MSDQRHKAVEVITSRTVVLPADNIDTDQIIPAQFLTTISREGLGKHLFHGWRFDSRGKPRPEFPLNQPDAKGARILVTGRNFGCGSSREHAPWALQDYGFQAVISTEIADIFRFNALKNGIVPVIADPDSHSWLMQHPNTEVTIDLESLTIRFGGDRKCSFPLDAFARYCVMNGVDELGYLLSREADIAQYEALR